jgi:hypothetical protein
MIWGSGNAEMPLALLPLKFHRGLPKIPVDGVPAAIIVAGAQFSRPSMKTYLGKCRRK